MYVRIQIHIHKYIHLINSTEKTDSNAHIDMYAENITLERGRS